MASRRNPFATSLSGGTATTNSTELDPSTPTWGNYNPYQQGGQAQVNAPPWQPSAQYPADDWRSVAVSAGTSPAATTYRAQPRGRQAQPGPLQPGPSSPGSYAPRLGSNALPTVEPGETPIWPELPQQGPFPPPVTHNATRLMEGDPGKLANKAHAATSNKYDFLQLMNSGQYGYDQLPQALAALQAGPNGGLWKGWKAEGDKLIPGDGTAPVDVIGGFHSDNPGGWRWGVEGPSGGSLGGSGGGYGGPGMTTNAPNLDWSGGQDLGMTEAQWRAMYPVPGAAPGTSTPASGANGHPTDLKSILEGLMSNAGNFNQGIVDKRTGAAQDTLLRQRSSQKKTNDAALASRGLMGSGPEGMANASLDQNIDDQYSNAVTGIYADESAAADSRMIQALQTSAGMSVAQAQQAIDMFRAQNDMTLGQGNLALGNRNAGINERLGLGGLALGGVNASNSYNLGLGRLGLDRDTLMNTIKQGDMGSLINLLQILLGGANTSAGGHV